MDIFKKFFNSWNASGKERLILLKRNIKKEISSFAQVNSLINEKFGLVKKATISSRELLQVKELNRNLDNIIRQLLIKEQKEETLQLRKLLKLALLMNPRDRPVIQKHLQYLYSELKIVERKMILLSVLISEEKEVWDQLKDLKVVYLPKVKLELQELISREKALMDNINALFMEIEKQLNKNLLIDMFGRETKFKCPKCKTRFVTVEKKQVKEAPRLHEYTFYCHFCDHVDTVTDSALTKTEEKWL